MHTKNQLIEMKSEHDQWQNKITFYRDEIKQLNRDLALVASPRAPKEVMASVEHFQNQFIRQREVLDIIRHEFKEHENLIEKLETDRVSEPDEIIKKMHTTQRDKIDQFEKIFNDLRGEFNIFLDKG